jgi:hypothetical protein
VPPANHPRGPGVRSGLRWGLMAAAAMLVLGGWLAAAPTGASPDDDYHLTSIWCSRGFAEGVCLPNPSGPWDRQTFVPFPVASMSCTAYDATVSGACQAEVLARDPRQLTLGIGGNVGGERAGLYYWVMHAFVSDDYPRAFASIRIANAALVIVMVAATMSLAAPALRRTVALTWLVGALPLGLFLVTSVNTSAWGLTGLGTAWANALTAASPGPRGRRAAAAALAAIGATIALGARTEALAHLLLGIPVVLLLRHATVGRARSVRSGRRRPTVGAVAVAAAGAVGLGVAVTLLPTPAYLAALLGAVGDGVADVAARGFGDPWLAVLLEVPQLWAGGLGDRWGLGWLDTPMPSLASVTTVGVFTALVALGLRGATRARGAAFGLALVGLLVLPGVSLLAAGLVVGEQFQPRHYLPALLLLLGAATLADRRSSGPVLGPGARAAFTASIAVANAAALHVTIRRYATGLTQARVWDLDLDVAWWWPALPSPMTVWAVTSLAFAVLAWLVLGLFAPQPTSGAAPTRPTE